MPAHETSINGCKTPSLGAPHLEKLCMHLAALAWAAAPVKDRGKIKRGRSLPYSPQKYPETQAACGCRRCVAALLCGRPCCASSQRAE